MCIRDRPYTYTVSEDAVEGYTSASATANGVTTFTNTRSGTTSVSVAKVWKD